MSAIDNYGEFDLPEEKIRIEVVEDPIKVILSNHELFLKLKEKNKFTHYLTHGKLAYDLSVKLFENKETFKPSSEDVNKAMNLMHNKNEYEWLGFFISAIHNSASLETLVVTDFGPDNLGFELKKDKVLVFGEKTWISNFTGIYSEGVIINYGQLLKEVGACSKKGIFINHSNMSFCLESMEDATVINTGTLNSRYTLLMKRNGSLINLGKIGSSERRRFNITVDIQNFPENLSKIPFDLKSDLKPKLDKTLKSIKYLQELKNADYKEQIKQYTSTSFDWEELNENICYIGGMTCYANARMMLDEIIKMKGYEA